MTTLPALGQPVALSHKAAAFLNLILAHARGDAHAIRLPREGGGGWRYEPVRRPIQSEDIRRHLTSETSCGVYLMMPGSNVTSLAVFDIDDHERKHGWPCVVEAAKDIREYLEPHGFRVVPIRSGSGTGIHLWLHWETPQKASNIRALMAWALQDLGLVGSGASHPSIEVFPKQDEAGDYGNLIALPFARSSTALDSDTWLPTDVPSDRGPSPSIDGVRIDMPERASGHAAPDPDVLRDALRFISADDYHDWTRIRFALKSALPGEDGFTLYDDWSKTSDKYKQRECRALWDHHARPKRIALGTLFFLAKRGGWKGPRLTLEDMNARHAFVLVGNKPAVIEESADTDGRPMLEIMSIEAFREWYREYRHERETPKGVRAVPLSNAWLDWHGKRKFRAIEFTPPPLRADPNTYNLFRGWSVKPSREGTFNLFLEHLREIVCQGNATHLEWLLAWLAAIFQKPAIKPGTALALRGKQGTGKSKVGEVIGHLLGPYHFKASSPHQVTGHFNSHLRNILVLQAEEAFWAGDRAAEGVLKDLITSDELRVEFKGKDIIKVRNCIRLFVTSNHDWVVPAAFDDRRFTVLDVGEGRMQDHRFFAAMDEELTAGGYEALLQYLLEYKYEEALIRRNLDTQGSRDQKLRSMDPWEAWVVDLMNQGWLPGDIDGTGRTHITQIQRDYRLHVQQHRGRPILSNAELGIRLPKWFSGFEKARRTIDGKIHYFYVFPSLGECRQALVDRMPGLDVTWDFSEEWDPDPLKAEGNSEDGDLPPF